MVLTFLTQDHDEIMEVLEGRMIFTLDDREIVTSAGDPPLLIPKGHVHALTCSTYPSSPPIASAMQFCEGSFLLNSLLPQFVGRELIDEQSKGSEPASQSVQDHPGHTKPFSFRTCAKQDACQASSVS